MAKKVLNGVLFNISWLLIVLAQDALLSWSVAAVHVCLHMWLLGRGRGELQVVAIAAAMGIAVDQLLFTAGVLGNTSGSTLAPLWLSALWPVFATTLLHAFSGLRPYPALAALVGGIGGYLSYRLGTALSGVAFAQPLMTDVVLLVFWGVLFPSLLVAAAQVGRSMEDGDVSPA